ncbi:MAG: hypothetical protein IME96_08330 [Proteobacteria bacterium]|nr:hypothetical protein [Pseudomonadota bacterium]
MNKINFRERIRSGIKADRSPNAKYELADAVQMVVMGLMAGATAMELEPVGNPVISMIILKLFDT